MNSWTKIVASFFLFLSLQSQACDFKPQVKKVFSLSGPVTSAFKELGLFKNPRLSGISIFYPARDEDFSGKIVPGGIFISPELKKEFNHSLVFFDESRELSKLFSTGDQITAREMKTRNLLPSEVTALVLREISPYLQGCEKGLSAYLDLSQQLEKEILAQIKKPLTVVIYVGEFVQGRAPEMVMANDGVVKWLRSQKKIISYPSELGYVNWSAKIINAMPANTYQVALKDSGRNTGPSFKKNSERQLSVSYPGGLIPGIDQMKAWIYWLKKI